MPADLSLERRRTAEGLQDVFEHGPGQLAALGGSEEGNEPLLGVHEVLHGYGDDRPHARTPRRTCARATSPA